MKIRIIKKSIKKLDCEVFKREANNSLKMIKKWSCIKHNNTKNNMKILTKNFYIKGKFINNGIW